MLNTNTSKDPILSESEESSYTEVKNRSLMLGRWFGQQSTTEGGIRQQINERKKDGTYRVTFRLKNTASEITEDIEVGQWGLSGPIYFSTFTGSVKNGKLHPANPDSATHYNAYKILALDEEMFKYQSYTSKSVYTLKKVDANFKFPDF